MKRGWMVLLLLAMVGGTAAAHAQISAYGEFSASSLQNGPQGDYLYGVSAGVLVDGPTVRKNFLLSADVGGRFVSKNGERLDSITVGPRFAYTPGFKKIVPFVAFTVGFGRYNDGAGNSTTDYLFGGQGGVTRRITNRLDVVLDYKYEPYGANFRFYTPGTASGGVVYHFVKR